MLNRALVLTWPFLLLAGQSPDPQAPNIRVSARLVQISVVAHHKDEPVSDLKKSDFKLLDGAKPRTISLFSVTSSQDGIKKASPLPPNTFANYIEHQENRPANITIILFDSINTPVDSQTYARQELIKFVKDIHPEDRIALYTLGGSLKILLDFTADAGEITRTLASISTLRSLESEASKTGPTDPLSNPRDVTQNQVSNGGLTVAAQMEADYFTESSIQITLRALEAIANHVARLPGRKNLVWISGGFPLALDLEAFHPLLQRRGFGDEMKRATRLLNEANVAIYPVDARGLIGYAAFGGLRTTASTSPALLPARLPGGTPLDNYPQGIDSMKELAGRTGGRAFYNTMDIKGSVRSAMEDSNVTYTLGFYLDPDSLDDKFHDIKIDVNRKGVDLRYRKGYFALKDEPHSDQQRRQEMAAALWSPLDATAIPLVMRLEAVDQPERGLLRAYLATDIHSLTVEQQSNGHWLGGVDVLLVQQDKTGKILDSSLQTLNLDLEKSNYEAMQKSGVPLGKYLRPKPGLVNVRAIVMDRPTRKVGSLIVPVAQVH